MALAVSFRHSFHFNEPKGKHNHNSYHWSVESRKVKNMVTLIPFSSSVLMIYDFHSEPKHIFLTTPMHTVHSFFQKNRCFCFLFIYVLAVLPSFSSVQFSHSVVSDSLWAHGLQASLSITNSGSLLKLMSIELVMPSSHLILCHPLLLLLSNLPSIRVFSNESVLRIRWPKC